MRSIKSIKSKNKIISIMVILVFVMLFSACGMADGDAGKANTYTWDGTDFSVKSITEVSSNEASEGKRICVTIDFGENQMSQKIFENNVVNGKFTLKGEKPEGDYQYHMGPSVFGANGFDQKITGEAAIFFSMDKDYEIDENDLVITE